MRGIYVNIVSVNPSVADVVIVGGYYIDYSTSLGQLYSTDCSSSDARLLTGPSMLYWLLSIGYWKVMNIIYN